MQVSNWSVPLALASWKIFYVPTGRQYSYLGTCLHEVAVMSAPPFFAASRTNHDVFHDFGPRFYWPRDSEFLMTGHVLCVTISDLLSEA